MSPAARGLLMALQRRDEPVLRLMHLPYGRWLVAGRRVNRRTVDELERLELVEVKADVYARHPTITLTEAGRASRYTKATG